MEHHTPSPPGTAGLSLRVSVTRKEINDIVYIALSCKEKLGNLCIIYDIFCLEISKSCKGPKLAIKQEVGTTYMSRNTVLMFI